MIHSNDALLVVDIQNDFCPGGALAVEGGDAIIPLVNRLMDCFGHVVITQDWHTADHISFADNHPNQKPFAEIDLEYGRQVLWPRHCVQGSFGAELHQDLQTTRANLIIRKGYRAHIDSYSAFLEADRITPTGLSGYLHAHGIERVFVVGLATDFCVAWTAMDAVHFGFDAFVIEDACRAIDTNNSLQQAWQNMHNWNVVKIQSSALSPTAVKPPTLGSGYKAVFLT